MKFLLFACLILSLFIALPASAEQKDSAAPTFVAALDMTEMNGIRFRDYADFQKKWELVTVRFRTDINEQRFIYANKSARAVLKNGSTDYPDGAVFGKIGVMTGDDPEFTSSKVPSGAVRVQFMVRNKKKYASTDGWGYALFNARGTRLVGDPPQTQAQACFACHQMAKDRGEVFAQLMNVWVAAPSTAAMGGIPASINASFSEKPVKQLPPEAQRLVPPGTDTVSFLEGPLRKHVFGGTLDEVRPTLIQEVKRAHRPAILLSEDNKHVSIIFPAAAKDSSCAKGYMAFKSYLVGFSRLEADKGADIENIFL